MKSPILAEPVRLAGLPGVAVPVRPVPALHERRVDRRAHARRPQRRQHRRHRAEDHPRGDLDHPALRARLLRHGIGQALRRDLVRGFGAPAFAGPGRGDRLPVGVQDRPLVGRIPVGRDQVHQPASGATLDILDHRRDVLGRPLAGHGAQDQPALGVDRDVVPGVPLPVVGGVGWVAVRFLLGDEGPLLIELDLTGVRGKKPRTRRGGHGRAPRRSGSGGRPCRGSPCGAGRSVGRRTPRRRAPGPLQPSPVGAANRTGVSPSARRSGPYFYCNRSLSLWVETRYPQFQERDEVRTESHPWRFSITRMPRRF